MKIEDLLDQEEANMLAARADTLYDYTKSASYSKIIELFIDKKKEIAFVKYDDAKKALNSIKATYYRMSSNYTKYAASAHLNPHIKETVKYRKAVKFSNERLGFYVHTIYSSQESFLPDGDKYLCIYNRDSNRWLDI